MKVKCKFFRGSFASWDELFGEASAFASEIGPTLVINISDMFKDAEVTLAGAEFGWRGNWRLVLREGRIAHFER